jgi:hypothetical protein
MADKIEVICEQMTGWLDLCLDFSGIDGGNLREAAEGIFTQVLQDDDMPKAYAKRKLEELPALKPGLALISPSEGDEINTGSSVVYFAGEDGEPTNGDASKTLMATDCPAIDYLNRSQVKLQSGDGCKDFSQELAYFYVTLTNWYLFGSSGLSQYRAGDIHGMAERKITRQLQSMCSAAG